ncbi:MAG: DUF3467 domain-containing protein [Actinomycetota bacterium]|nr:DUF3467 domain-containing protein [Nitrospiraceae bacterium]MDA8155282.1 DUF3467 domain-containing protein [Actinomycetota bacterium]
MPNNDQPEKRAQGNAPKRVRFIEDGVKTQYASFFNIGLGPEEVFFNFGNHSMEPGTVRIESRVAVSLKTEKRIAMALGGLIQRYETDNGALDGKYEETAH